MLTGATLEQLRSDIKYKALYRCELCHRWTLHGHCHHIKSRGAGGDDTYENMVYLCVGCHTDAHNGKISKHELMVLRSPEQSGTGTKD
uniref:Putative homing endonuclease n=1 Tax=viral metagenome TaxID=1070528 RepID=A0A6H1ZL28_9ZZZZ